MSSSIDSCQRVHHIEVELLEEGDTVEQSLLLVKGRVQPSCSKAKQLTATLALGRAEEQEQLTQLSVAGEFKLLFDLAAGETQQDIGSETQYLLQLRCCSSERRLQFRYKLRRNAYRVQPLYVVCQREKHQKEQKQEVEERCALIDLNLRLVQCIYAHKLHAAGYSKRSFTLNGACCIFRSQLSCAAARASSEQQLWQHLAEELLSSDQWGAQRHLKFIAFIGCTLYDGAAVAASGDYSYANIRRHLQAHAALGGGGLALFGSAYFYAWPRTFEQILPCIRSKQRVNAALEPDESNYRRTYGGVYASSLGAVCHELGHCFDLGHTLEGIMGHGFDYLNRVLTVDQPTEHLPQRLVAAAPAPAPTRSRLTKLNAGSTYLDNYHAQRRNDSFYFTENCAAILAQHRWLHPQRPEESSPEPEKPAVDIALQPETREIVSSVPLRVVELRCNLNSLVQHYEIFEQETLRFQLPESLWQLLGAKGTHYAFVLTIDGDIKRLSCEPTDVSN